MVVDTGGTIKDKVMSGAPGGASFGPDSRAKIAAGLAASTSAARASDDGGLGVVRVKPLGIGASDKNAQKTIGAMNSANFAKSAMSQAVQFSTEQNDIAVDGRVFRYPSHVISPDMDNEKLYQ